MPRMPRVVIPGFPHHVTQRGSRRQPTFFRDRDYETYLEILAKNCRISSVEVWAYCLMPNHVHLILVPGTENGLAHLLRNTHSTYARQINERNGWTGHLWQERFHSFVMDDTHLMAAVRYVELNPIRAGLCARPEDWPWSSARRHLLGSPDRLLLSAPLRRRVHDWAAYLEGENPPEMTSTLRRLTNSGYPGGDAKFIRAVEAISGRNLTRRKPRNRGQ